MPIQSLRMSIVLPAPPARLYDAWLSSKEHSAFTGAKAKVAAKVGGKHSAWDGYISGKTLELVPKRRIVQAWRTTDFSEESPDSRLEITFAPTPKGTRLTLKHTAIPKGQVSAYRQGWKDYYFAPMKAYFA
jgi:activator of HSP90 ATPase